MRVSVAPGRKLCTVLHCAQCSLFVAVSASRFVARSLRVLECSYEDAASLASAEAT